MFGTRKTSGRNGRGPTLASLGVTDVTAAGAHQALVASGWPEIGHGYHGSVHAHEDHPGVVVRLARKVDGFGDYAALLRRGFHGSEGPHAPRILDMRVSRCGALLTVSSRLSEPPGDAWWLPFAHAVIAGATMDEGVRERFVATWPGHVPHVDAPSFDGVRERFRAAWPGYEPFVEALRRVAPQGLDPNVGNVLVDGEGRPVVNDPLCDDGHGLWLSPSRRLALRWSAALRGLAATGRRRSPVAA